MQSITEQLSFEQQKKIHYALATTTIPHIGKSAGLFSPLSFDPIGNPSQNLNTVVMPAVTTTPEDAENHAMLADQRLYGGIKEELLTQGAFMAILRKQRSEQHIFPVTTHQKIPDVVIQLAATSLAEYELFDTVPWHDIVNTNGLVLSRGIATLQAFGLAAPEVTQKGGTTFMSFPRTDTIATIAEAMNLPGDKTFDDIVNENNARMRKAVNEWLPAGRENILDRITVHPEPKKRLYMAWEGTTAKTIGEDSFNPERIEMSAVNPAVLSMIKHGLTLPSVIWDRGPNNDPIFITGEMKKLKSTTDIATVQEWQRKTLAKSLGLPDDHVTIRV